MADHGRQPGGLLDDAPNMEQLARLLRVTETAPLSQEVKASLRARLLNAFGASSAEITATPDVVVETPAVVPEAKSSEPTVAEPRRQAEAEPPRQAASLADDSIDTQVHKAVAPSPVIASDIAAEIDTEEQTESGQWEDLARQVDLKIRKLVERNAGWEAIEPLAWRMLDLRGDARAAATLVELVFLHGSTTDLESALVGLARRGKQFYLEIHAAVRAHMVARLWRENLDGTLSSLLYRHRDAPKLQPIERLFVVVKMTAAPDPASPYIYYRRHRQEIESALENLGDHVGLRSSRFFLTFGKMANDLGYPLEARELFHRILPGETEYDRALELLAELSGGDAGATYENLLLGETDCEHRLVILARLLDTARRMGGVHDRNRPHLNKLLADPLQYFDEDPVIWGKLSELLTRNRDLKTILPSIDELFISNALVFRDSVMDSALWQGPIKSKSTKATDCYWRGVGYLHSYVSFGSESEATVWKAYDEISKARQDRSASTPYSWTKLHHAALQYIARNPRLAEPERRRMLRQIKVVLPADALATLDLEDYLRQENTTSNDLLLRLEQLARQKGDTANELKILRRRAGRTLTANEDLDRYWRLANQDLDHDLAWRVASVLEGRKSLLPQIRPAWQISGERRSHYAHMIITQKAVDTIVNQWPGEDQRLCLALVQVGALVPDLMAAGDKSAHSFRWPVPAKGSREAKVVQVCESQPWLQRPRRSQAWIFDGGRKPGQAAPFMYSKPQSEWGQIYCTLADRLGLYAWGWKPKKLHEATVDIVPRMAAQGELRRDSTRVAKWLRALTPAQRNAWKDLSILCAAGDSEHLLMTWAKFIGRLTAVMYQDHYQALTTLQRVRAPLALLRDLESWIVSPEYGEIRRQLGTAHKVMVPPSLQRLAQVSAKPF